jgi:hypothetical protein
MAYVLKDSLQVQSNVIIAGSTTGTVTLASPATVTTGYTVTFPAAVPTTGQVLSSVDAAGSLTWVSKQDIINAAAGSILKQGPTAGSVVAASPGTDFVPASSPTTNLTLATTKFSQTGGSVTLQADSTTSINQTYTLPAVAPTAGQVLTSNASGSLTWTTPTTGTVTTASVVSANGFSGTVATASTTPAITITTYIGTAATPVLLKGNGTAISAAVSGTDYSLPVTTTISSTTANVTSIVAGTNITLSNTSGALTISASGGGGGSGTVTTVSVASNNGFAGTVATASSTPAITISTSIGSVATPALLKGNGTAISAATAGTDYQAAINLTAGKLLKQGASSGTIAEAVSGTDYSVPITSSISGTSTNVTSITAGSNVTLTNTSGTLTIAASGSGVRYYSGAASAGSPSILTNSAIAAILVTGTVAKTGDIFTDTSTRANNINPNYINIGGNWLQLMTAFGGN